MKKYDAGFGIYPFLGVSDFSSRVQLLLFTETVLSVARHK